MQNFNTLPQEIQNLILEKTDFLTIIENFSENKYILNKLYQQEKLFWTIEIVTSFNTRRCECFDLHYRTKINHPVILDLGYSVLTIYNQNKSKECTCSCIYNLNRIITEKVQLDIIIFLKCYIQNVYYTDFSIKFMLGHKPSNIDLLLLRLYKISQEMICEFRKHKEYSVRATENSSISYHG